MTTTDAHLSTHPSHPAASARATREGASAPATVTYEEIARNVANVTVDGAQVRVLWKNPRTGTLVGESVAAMSIDTSIAGRMQAVMKRSVVQEIAASIMGVISQLLGGVLGRIVRNVSYSASYDLQSRALAGVGFTETTRREAVVRAFAEIRTKYEWDAEQRVYHPVDDIG